VRYPKVTIFLAVLVALVAWIAISGREPPRAAADLAPPATHPTVDGAVLVIGGTRGTGLEVVRLLRARGEAVVVLARTESDTRELETMGVRIIRGNALRQVEMKQAMTLAPVRAVVSTLGARTVKEPRPDFEGNRNAVDAAKAAGVKRFVLVTVIGAGNSLDASPALARRFLKDVIAAKSQAEDYLKISGLDYTIIRPGGLLDKEAQGRAYLTEDTASMAWIRRADLARLVVQALDDPRAVGKTYHAFDPDRTRFWSMFRN
jgi:uncharacterized protein YbjT (DUF2867 family)